MAPPVRAASYWSETRNLALDRHAEEAALTSAKLCRGALCSSGNVPTALHSNARTYRAVVRQAAQ
jgi:hypothetical protein